MIDLDKLRKLAESATPGPWQTEGGMNLYVFTANNHTMIAESRGTGAGLSDEQQTANAAFIASANPATILALLDVVEAAQEVNAVYWDFDRSMKTEAEALRDALLRLDGKEGKT